MAAPRASSAAACRPREVFVIPAFRFFFRSCSSTSVALAGKIAGNARKRPPNTGPNRLASKPAITVMAPPNKNRTPYSYHLVPARADRSTVTLIACYRKTIAQTPRAQTSHRASAEIDANAECIRFLIINRLQNAAYTQNAIAPTTIERASAAA